MCNDFDTRNRADWSAAIQQAFGIAPPQSARWTDLDAMVHVLSPFMQENLNHTMLSGHGGFDMVGIARSAEPECLEFSSSSRSAELFCPTTLFFEYFSESPWNSFLLVETQPLQPSGVYEENDGLYEEVLEVAPAEYTDRYHFDDGNLGYDENNQEIPLPENCRIIARHMRGKFLVVAKRSLWNRDTATYDGRHRNMTAQQIRERIQDAIDVTERNSQ